MVARPLYGDSATITRSSAMDFRFFEVTGGTGNRTLNALTMRNGRTDSNTATGTNAGGGGIVGTVTLAGAMAANCGNPSTVPGCS
jgi:hypothetical protein